MHCVLPTAYLAPVSYYTQLSRHERVWTEVCDTFGKRGLGNRCRIGSPQGPLTLSIPVRQPHGQMTKDVRISDHADWRHQHWNALKSAYGSSPYFQFYEDDFAPFYEKRWEYLVDYNEELERLVCRLLGISPDIRRTETFQGQTEAAPFGAKRLSPSLGLMRPLGQHLGSATEELATLRRWGKTNGAHPASRRARRMSNGAHGVCKPYTQVFSAETGFLPDLSIVDLLFNMGPESVLYL